MRRSHGTLLFITIGGAFVVHVLAMIFFSSVVVVTVGNPNAGYREVDFTEIDFAYELVTITPPITKHFAPPKLPQLKEIKSLGSLEIMQGQRKLFDSGFSVDKDILAEDNKDEALSTPPVELHLNDMPQVEVESIGGIEVRTGVYSLVGKPIKRKILFKPSIADYPLWAEVQEVEFKSRFVITVSTGGRVLRVRNIISSGSSDIDKISKLYLSKWKFKPVAARKGIKEYVVPINFTIIK